MSDKLAGGLVMVGQKQKRPPFGSLFKIKIRNALLFHTILDRFDGS
jgi:hypothetical protein